VNKGAIGKWKDRMSIGILFDSFVVNYGTDLKDLFNTKARVRKIKKYNGPCPQEKIND
jgi:hypothetical protein